MIDLRPGDFAIVGSKSILGKAISDAESREALGDSRYIHAFLVLDKCGSILDTDWRVRYAKIQDYKGCQALIGRYKYLRSSDWTRARTVLIKDLGERYPIWRLLLDKLGLGRELHGKKMVCSERVVRGLWLSTGMEEFRDFWGWLPSDLDEIIRHWDQFEKVFEGVL